MLYENGRERIGIATLFSGGEGVGCGAKAAGLHHRWGIEYDDDIAQVARDNGFNVTTADVTLVDPATLERVDILHASPPCPNFSVAKANAEETENDIALARAVARFIIHLTPKIFTLENVYQYRKSQSWELIARTLNDCGYWFDAAHVNAADFGVPQTRKRMIVRAVLGQMVPCLPPAEPWVSWYEVVEDLIPTLPESEFAPWQLKRLEKMKIHDMTLFGNSGYAVRIPRATATMPANTITANRNQLTLGAFIVDSQNNGSSDSNGVRGLTIRNSSAPVFTITASQNKEFLRSLVDNNRVVQMTTRCLARFQSFPDWYKLPDNKQLACRVIGNAVPPLLYEKIIRQLCDALND